MVEPLMRDGRASVWVCVEMGLLVSADVARVLARVPLLFSANSWRVLRVVQGRFTIDSTEKVGPSYGAAAAPH